MIPPPATPPVACLRPAIRRDRQVCGGRKFIRIRRTAPSLGFVTLGSVTLGLRAAPDSERAGSTAADILVYAGPILAAACLVVATLFETHQIIPSPVAAGRQVFDLVTGDGIMSVI